MADFYGASSEPGSVEEFAERFPSWVLGRGVWQHWIRERLWDQDNTDESLDTLRRGLRDGGQAEPDCPRVFVSHRQHDDKPALAIARLANQVGFEFWLDLLDPQLQNLTPSQRAQHALIASIVEVALLNCTHVIAVLSDKTRGTLWVPYEYGRVKEKRQVRSRRAAVWLDPNIDPADVPEYTVLGVTTRIKPEIAAWFRTELSLWQTTGKCHGGAGNEWKGDEPEYQLPT
jgi:hypothetical protein